MRIHSDVLTTDDFYRAARAVSEVAPDIYVDSCSVHGSRSRAHGYEVALRGSGRRHVRRPNSGRFGATSDNSYAATYHDWGWWLAELYRLDPDMVAGHYKSAEDFHRQTEDKYLSVMSI